MAADDAETGGDPAAPDAEVADPKAESAARDAVGETKAAEAADVPAEAGEATARPDTADPESAADEPTAAVESAEPGDAGAGEARDGGDAAPASEGGEPARAAVAEPVHDAPEGAGSSEGDALAPADASAESGDGEDATLATASGAAVAPLAVSAAESVEGESPAESADGSDASEAAEPAASDADADAQPPAVPADDPDTALLAPVSAAPAADPDTALLRPVGKGKPGGEADEIDAWVASLGHTPVELEAKPDESGDGGDSADTGKAGESGEPSGRKRLVNPWMAAAGVAALLLAGAAVVQNPFTMATAQRVPQSDVPRMSDPEPPKDSAPVDGGSARDLELPPVLPAAAPGSAGSPQPSGVIGTISASPSPTRTSAPPAAAPINAGSNGIPQIVLAAYQQAAATTAKADPACKLPWQLLAGIGRVESSHANNGQVTANGTAVTPILGPRLDGSHSTAVIRDTDKGAYDLDPEYDRAVGPMQFIPSTWKSYGMDGNKDGKTDPENVYDASLAAARYLCAGDRDLSRPADLDRAIYSYNKSTEYVSTVKAWMQFYGNGVRPIPATTAPAAPNTTKATTKSTAATTKSGG